MIICAVIMAGGQEMRFGPIKKYIGPKQTIHIDGRAEILIETIHRCKGLIKLEDIYIVTNQDQKLIFDEIIDSKRDKSLYQSVNFFIEPKPKNTAPCILYSALKIKQIYKNSNEEIIMCVFPSDHDIPNDSAFKEVLDQAISVASETKRMVTIGIKPSFPATAYGYIQYKQESGKNYCNVTKFKEKPELETAQEYFKSREYFWNSGIFVWNIDTILDQFQKYFSDGYDLFKSVNDINYFDSKTETKSWVEAYGKVRKISVDYAIMQETDPENILVVSGNFKWQDIGKWDALLALFSNQKGIINVDIVGVDKQNSTIFSTGKYIYRHDETFTFDFSENSYVWLYCKQEDKEGVINILKNHENYDINLFHSIQIDSLMSDLIKRQSDEKSFSPQPNSSIEPAYKLSNKPIAFISHSSADKSFADCIEELLVGLGVPENQIIYTSHESHTIPLGENIYEFLRNNILNGVNVMYLFSQNYFNSTYCNTELGAAWISRSDYTVFFVPDFNFHDPKFIDSAIDTKKIGITLNGDDICMSRLMNFKDEIIMKFNLKIDDNRASLLLHKITNKLKRLIV